MHRARTGVVPLVALAAMFASGASATAATCLDPAALSVPSTRITSAAAISQEPSLVWTGSQYGVAWHEARDGDAAILFARLDAAGNGIGPALRVSEAASLSFSPSLVWTGTEYGLSWHEWGGVDDGIRFARLDAAGNRIGPVVSVTDAELPDASSLVWTGAGFGVSWHAFRDGNFEIHFARLDAAGNKVGLDVRVTDASSQSQVPSLVWTGAEYGVAWSDSRDGSYEIYFARLSAAGILVSADVRLTQDSFTSYAPSLVWTGVEYGLSWFDERDGNAEIYFARLDDAGNRIGADRRLTVDAASSARPSLVWTGSEYGVAWQDTSNGSAEIYFAKVDAAGNKVGVDVRVTHDGSAVAPVLIWTGEQYGVSWQTTLAGADEIAFTRIRCSGNCADPDGDGFCPGDDCDENVATCSLDCTTDLDSDGSRDCDDGCFDSDGDDYGEAGPAANTCTGPDCNDSDPAVHPGAQEICNGVDDDCDEIGDLDPARVGQDFLAATGTPAYPALVRAGASDALAWFREGHLRFATLDPSARRIGAETPVAAVPPDVSNLTMAWTGSQFGVAWREGTSAVRFVALAPDGSPLGTPSTVNDGTISPGVSNLGPLTWNGSEFALIWESVQGCGTRGSVFFARVSPAGVKQGNEADLLTPIECGAYNDDPAMVWNGDGYAVAWVRDYTEGMFLLIDGEGNRLGPSKPRVFDARHFQHRLALVWNGSVYGIASVGDFHDGLFGGLYFSLLDASGDNLSSVSVSRPACDLVVQDQVALAWNGTEWGAAYGESCVGENAGPVFVRFGEDGLPIGPAVLASPEAAGAAASLAWNGSDYLLAWPDRRNGGEDVYVARVSPTGCHCDDADADGFDRCADCDDVDPSVAPGASEVCDGLNNDCLDAAWPSTPDDEVDDDLDSYSECAGDCDDAASTVYPQAPPLCDGLNNDCTDPAWPTPQAHDVDDDLDGYAECDGDCNDASTSVSPAGVETCNSIDDDCDALVDEDDLGQDTDGDGVRNACDNCRERINPTQLDTDHDGIGSSCDNCALTPNVDQADRDLDLRGDVCDNCPADYNLVQDDWDADATGDACDNCVFDPNPAQSDTDSDREGDLCDFDDGLIYVLFHEPGYVEWQEETGFSSWNLYRGDLGVLRSTGVYAQNPAAVPLAARACDLTSPWLADAEPPPGAALFFLATGNAFGSGVESSLGTDSFGVERINTSPCALLELAPPFVSWEAPSHIHATTPEPGEP